MKLSKSAEEVIKDIKNHFKREDAWPLSFIAYYEMSKLLEWDFLDILYKNGFTVKIPKGKRCITIAKKRDVR